MSIYKVTAEGLPGFELGDEMTEKEALGFLNTMNADKITVFPDAARARLDMRDVTPSKPVGTTPSAADTVTRAYHPDMAVGGLSESGDVYVGVAAHANPGIRQPSMEERLRDANPNHKIDLGAAVEARKEQEEEFNSVKKDSFFDSTSTPSANPHSADAPGAESDSKVKVS